MTGQVSSSAQRNPAWSRDELILALELYMRHPDAPPSKDSQPVAELSRLLNRSSRAMDRAANFRNPNGVYMKMMNFRRLDPAFTASGRVGLTRGNKEEGAVWADFANDHDRLVAVASAIRSAIGLEASLLVTEDDHVVEATEGAVLTRLHRVRERSRKLVERRKARALREFGVLRCEACDFNFEDAYGERGRGFIEVHHTKPLAALTTERKTKLDDLALVCANCHRMVHSKRPWLSIDELRRLIDGSRTADASNT